MENRAELLKSLDTLSGVHLLRAYRDLAVLSGHKDPFKCYKCDFPLFPNLDYDDSAYLYCVGCGYKQYPGSAAMEVMRRALQFDT